MMKNRYVLLSTLIAVSLLAGCSSMTTPKQIVNVQADTLASLPCASIASTLHDIEFEVAELLKLKEQRQQRSFALKTLLNMTMAFLSAPSAVDRVGSTSDPMTRGLTEKEYERMIQLKQYYRLVVSAGNDKGCQYSKSIQQRINQFQSSH